MRHPTFLCCGHPLYISTKLFFIIARPHQVRQMSPAQSHTNTYAYRKPISIARCDKLKFPTLEVKKPNYLRSEMMFEARNLNCIFMSMMTSQMCLTRVRVCVCVCVRVIRLGQLDWDWHD